MLPTQKFRPLSNRTEARCGALRPVSESEGCVGAFWAVGCLLFSLLFVQGQRKPVCQVGEVSAAFSTGSVPSG